MWLAQQHGFEINSDLIYMLIIVIFSVVGTIFGRKNKPEERKSRQEPPREVEPAVSRPPLPARPAEPPIPADRPVGGSESVLPPAPFERPVARPQSVPQSQSASRPQSVPSQPPWITTGPRKRRPAPSRREAATVEPIAVEIVAKPAADSAESATKPMPAKRAGFDSTAIQRRLRSPADLRTAFILSEILAPPVGLRDNQQSV